METLFHTFEVQVDEKPNGAVIRINDKRGCRIRICSIPKELVFDEQGEVRTFIDITYPKQMNRYEKAKALTELGKLALETHKAMITATQKPKNLRLSKLGERLKKK
jgi:hypothetical protein